jgi:hypothetical protein
MMAQPGTWARKSGGNDDVETGATLRSFGDAIPLVAANLMR